MELPSLDGLQARKRALKAEMKRWEADWEAQNGGLVPTHDDKKEDARYSALKKQAKQLEAALELVRSSTKVLKPETGQTAILRRVRDRGAFDEDGSFVQGDAAQHPDADLASLFEEPVNLSVWDVFKLTILGILPYAVFLICFSLMTPVGPTLFEYLTTKTQLYTPVLSSGVAVPPSTWQWANPALGVWPRAALARAWGNGRGVRG